jgi:hypothetical protein
MIHRLTPAFRDTRFPHVFAVEIPVDDSQYGASKTNLTPGSASPTHGKKLGRRDWKRSVPLQDHDEDKELLRLMGRKHTRLSKCEYESWIYTRMEYADQERKGALVDKEAFFWRVEFDPKTLRRGAIHK